MMCSRIGLAKVAAVVLLLCATCRADAPAREYQVKAAFIFNFTQFIEWPADAFPNEGAPFVVAVVGKDPFDGALEKIMSGKTVRGRSIEVQHFATAADIKHCQILFVPASEDASLGDILAKTAKDSVLVVGESDSVMDAGAAVRLFLEDAKMRFELNTDVCDAAKLRVSSKLMRLARLYKKK